MIRGLVAALVATLAACGGGGGGDSAPGTTITVFAAASLADAMTDLTTAFEREHDAASVELSFGPSSGMREQILSGAPADVFATADAADMEVLVSAGEIDGPEVLARNRLQIAVPAGNPANIVGLADFGRSELFIGLCAAEVPCGAYGREALTNAGVTPATDTEASDVRALLTQIASGDLDAGLVYVTDVLAADGAVTGLDLPPDVNVVADYSIATTRRSDARELSQRFVDFVRSADGQAILESHGFVT